MPVMIQETLEALSIFNHLEENWDLKPYAPGTRTKAIDHQWAGARARRLLELVYRIAFLCLLCVDEVLKIQSHELIVLAGNRLQLTLPFRKTSQFGGVPVCSFFKPWLMC